MATVAQTHPVVQTRTLSALSYPNFRLYFTGQLISISGSWMQIIAQGWLVFFLTKSELWLGIVSAAAGLPSLVLSPFAGVFVDRLSRRNILLFTQTVQMMLAFALALLTFQGTVQVWHIVALAFLLGITNAIDAPARQSIIVDLVGKKDLTSGIALSSMTFNASRVFGPAAAAIVLTLIGPAWCFFLNGVSFLAVLAMLLIMRVQHHNKGVSTLSPLEQLRVGLRFSRHHPTIAPLLLLTCVGSLFMANLSTLLPAFADVVLHSPKVAYSAMAASVGVGALCASLSVAALGRRFGRGRVISAMVIFVAISSVAASLAKDVNTAVILMGLYGFGTVLQFVTGNTLVQSEVADEFRGRVMSLYTLTFFGISPFGALVLGFLASGIGVNPSLLMSPAANGLPNLSLVNWGSAIQGIGTPAAMGLYAIIGGALSIYIVLRARRVRQLI
jgi:MFS family permease